MAIMLVRSQRDGVHRFVLRDLDDIELAAIALEKGDVDRRQSLRQQFKEDVRLLDQIGWELAARKEVYAVMLPADEIRATFGRLYAKAIGILRCDSPEVFGSDVRWLAFKVSETCAVVLRELPSGVRPRP
jgi:hypothetical protein